MRPASATRVSVRDDVSTAAIRHREHTWVAGAALVLTAAACFGAMSIFAKLSLDNGASVSTVLATRYVLSALVALPIALLWRRARPSVRGARLWLGAAIANVIGAGAYVAAIDVGDVSQALPVVYVFPIIVVAISTLVLRRPLDGRTGLTALLGVTGSILVLELGGAGSAPARAIGLAVASAFAAALYYLLMTRPAREGSWATGVALILIVGALLFGTLAAIAGPGWPSGVGWLYLALTALVGTLIPFGLLVVGVGRVGPSHGAVLSLFEPLVAVALAVAVLGESLGVVQALGIALVLAAFILISQRRQVVATLRRSRLPTSGEAPS